MIIKFRLSCELGTEVGAEEFIFSHSGGWVVRSEELGKFTEEWGLIWSPSQWVSAYRETL